MKKIEKILESITAVILLVMLICCLLQVLFRFVLHISAPFTEEFARMGYILDGVFDAAPAGGEKRAAESDFFLR